MLCVFIDSFVVEIILEAGMSPEQSSGKIGKSVGEKLRAARIALHYTQSQLAAPDFSVSYISAIERGQIHPSLRALEILATRLGLSSTQLLPNRGQTEDRLSDSSDLTMRDDNETDLTLLQAQLDIRSDEPLSSIVLLERLSAKRLTRQQQLQRSYYLGWAYFKAMRYQECEYTLSDSLQLAKDLNIHYLLTHILYVLAMAYSAMHNHTQALLYYQRCLNALETAPVNDPFFTAEIYMHMGQYHTQSERLDSAIEMFHKALETIASYTTNQARGAINLSLSHYYSELKDYELAAQYAYNCIYLSTQDAAKHRRSELYHYLGQAYMKSDREKAWAFFDEAQSLESVQHDALALASIYTHKAEWYLEQGQLEQAASQAKQAQEMAIPFGESIVAAEASITLGRIEYAGEDYAQGDKHFIAGLQMIENLGRHEELADESVRYAELLEQHGQAREAFNFFRRAFESRQALGR
jgi:tetratricopeptide (TPR) repeat protein